MTHRGMALMAVFTATLCCVTVGPIAGAAASSRSIKVAIVRYGPKIKASEEAVSKAVEEFKTSNDPTGVESAIGNAAAVLSSLRSKVAHQSAATPRVKKAKTKILQGLHALVAGYKVLSKAYAEKATSPAAASADAHSSLVLIAKGKKELDQGASLLP
ncbi:MAG TPA: hypothetical protein VNR42_09845 [Solirubrobacteraceae bacterium]|nr:hypothetical protein [Solirubrobacteraceae bacterium]